MEQSQHSEQSYPTSILKKSQAKNIKGHVAIESPQKSKIAYFAFITDTLGADFLCPNCAPVLRNWEAKNAADLAERVLKEQKGEIEYQKHSWGTCLCTKLEIIITTIEKCDECKVRQVQSLDHDEGVTSLWQFATDLQGILVDDNASSVCPQHRGSYTAYSDSRCELYYRSDCEIYLTKQIDELQQEIQTMDSFHVEHNLLNLRKCNLMKQRERLLKSKEIQSQMEESQNRLEEFMDI